MNLPLPADLQKLIDDRVQSGKYASPQDVLAGAMAALEQQEQITQLGAADLATLFPDLKEKLVEGLTAARNGDLIDGEAFFDELDREEEERTTGRKSA